MRKTLLGGLLAAGLLTGCGGTDVEAQEVSCYDACRQLYGLCMRAAQGDLEEQQQCAREYLTCNEFCPSPGVSR
ncbi:hypothetical protein D7Y15_11830 [Corallococcus sp. AB030]|uniref:hypothetical protein n=1 Tax=unclassified Corallococcus TaxID=2685029 RepID=UPI000EE8F4F2|nr:MULTISPECIES: hypothetical protein [unclassified Corallococcus]RKI16635.1 hypothetical protein D7Y15_11830 [Corallococcus sp. AB030]RUO92944.1 hypothetical protein D7Y11_12180 [Corallococcus sp. AB018]